jgi:hypothetical protein
MLMRQRIYKIRIKWLSFFASPFFFFNANHAIACASCLCGDPTLTTMGVEKPFPGRKRVGIEYLSRSETSGTKNIDQHAIEEERMTYHFSYAPSKSWMFAASLPMITKKVARFDESSEQGSGVGDIDLSARWFIAQPTSIARKRLWGAHFGLRLPSSEEETLNGDVINFDAQPSAGALTHSLGLWWGEYQRPWFFYSSAIVQHASAKGYQGYEAGDALLVTLQAQYTLHPQLALQVGLDSRWKDQDQYNDEVDENSGGALIMASLGLAWSPVTDWLFNFNVQHPAIENSHGVQKEETALRAGVTYDF